MLRGEIPRFPPCRLTVCRALTSAPSRIVFCNPPRRTTNRRRGRASLISGITLQRKIPSLPGHRSLPCRGETHRPMPSRRRRRYARRGGRSPLRPQFLIPTEICPTPNLHHPRHGGPRRRKTGAILSLMPWVMPRGLSLRIPFRCHPLRRLRGKILRRFRSLSLPRPHLLKSPPSLEPPLRLHHLPCRLPRQSCPLRGILHHPRSLRRHLHLLTR